MAPIRTLFFVPLMLAIACACVSRPAGATTYNRSTGPGLFRQASLWSPYFPPGALGPGGASDNVKFNLNTNPDTPYTVTNVSGENDRMLVGNDSLILNVDQYALNGSFPTDQGLTMGLAADQFAYVTLDGTAASHMSTNSTQIADATGSRASLFIHHIQFDGGTTQVGYGGDAQLGIFDGAHVTTFQTYIAARSISDASAFVTGVGSTLSTSEILVGEVGRGLLSLYGGGQATSTRSTIGYAAGSQGQVYTSDLGTSWAVTNELKIGAHGAGTLSVYQGGVVSSGRASVGIYSDGSGIVNVSKPGSHWAVNGTLSIGGDSTSGETQGHGTVSVFDQGRLDVSGTTTIYAGGVLNLQGGSFYAPAIAFQGGTLNWTGGKLTVGMINGSVTNPGGVLAPGAVTGSTTVAGNYTQMAGGTLAIDLGGTAAGSTYDSIGVAGSAILGGALELDLANGFAPQATDTFSIFNAVGGVLGVFNNVGSGQRLTLENGAGSFVVNYGITSAFNPNQVVLSSFLRTFTADFDVDGDVDMDDYTIWRGAFGLNHLGDANGDNISDAADYTVWRNQLGSAVSPGAGAVAALHSAAAPEPGTAVLVLSAIGGGIATARRRRLVRCGDSLSIN